MMTESLTRLKDTQRKVISFQKSCHVDLTMSMVCMDH